VFAYAGLAIGLFGIAFLGVTPSIVEKFGGTAFFLVFSLVMAIAAVVAMLFFPRHADRAASRSSVRASDHSPLRRAVWYSVVAIALLAMTQAMTLSFFERIGMARGFGFPLVSFALVIYGIVTLFPAPLAALLERRIAATTVISTVPFMQFVFAMAITPTHSYPVYAISGAMMAFTILFTHTFAFGLLAKLDPTSRAVAGTPAMLMMGAAIGPFIGGSLVKFIGFEAIGYCAFVLVVLELILFNRARRIVAAHRPAAPVAEGASSGEQSLQHPDSRRPDGCSLSLE
jgi:predicted MFS family arabinose efflux permease